MFNIALTGGIASGKSLIGQLFAKKNITVIDTDNIARSLLNNSEHLSTLFKHFGKRIITADNKLDRAELADIIFNDKQQKKWLEQYLHPVIYQSLFQQLEQSDSIYSISLIPLLIESKQQQRFDRVLVVDCDSNTQLERLQQRNQLGKKQAMARINSQISNNERILAADDLIKNDKKTTLPQLDAQVEQLHKKYLKLAGAKISNQG